MSALQSFATTGTAPGDRLETWKAFFQDTIGSVRAEACGEFEGHVGYGQLGELALAQLAVGPHRIARTPELARRDGQGMFKLVFQLSGACAFEQDGREVWLSPGQWSFYDTGRPYQVFNPEPTEQLILLAPRSLLVDGNLHVARCPMGAFSARDGVGRVLFALLRSAFDELETLDASSRRQIGEAAAELVRAATFEILRSRPAQSVRDTWVERIRTYVDRRLRDPELSVDQTAAALGVSKRYIHKLFCDADETLSRYILRRRLERCREDLLDPRLAGESITAIAFGWGFNDASHFSHAFRKHFGASPSELRATKARSAEERPSVAASGS